MDTMPADKFFAYAAELLKVIPPHITDQPMIAQMKKIGIEPGKSFDLERPIPPFARLWQAAPEDARNSWHGSADARARRERLVDEHRTMGVYGNYYLKRAIIRSTGLGAIFPKMPIYPFNLGDDSGKPLMGQTDTRSIRQRRAPAGKAFWSVTLYDADGFQVANPLNRFAVSSWMPFQYNADDTRPVFPERKSCRDREANWLPAPKGPFNLTMRLYAPKSEVLTGKWNPPPSRVRRQFSAWAVSKAIPSGLEAAHALLGRILPAQVRAGNTGEQPEQETAKTTINYGAVRTSVPS